MCQVIYHSPAGTKPSLACPAGKPRRWSRKQRGFPPHDEPCPLFVDGTDMTYLLPRDTPKRVDKPVPWLTDREATTLSQELHELTDILCAEWVLCFP